MTLADRESLIEEIYNNENNFHSTDKDVMMYSMDELRDMTDDELISLLDIDSSDTYLLGC